MVSGGSERDTLSVLTVRGAHGQVATTLWVPLHVQIYSNHSHIALAMQLGALEMFAIDSWDVMI